VIAATALLIAALAQTPHAPQRLEGEHLTTPEQEARALRLGKQIRCAVCQGLSIADSPASMARAQLDAVRSLVVEGKSDQEIYDYFVARYGEWALLAPPVRDFNLVLWLGPGLVLLLGAFIVYRVVRRTPAELKK
jgi:cytochrome c-type biogenesis protein CcmH